MRRAGRAPLAACVLAAIVALGAVGTTGALVGLGEGSLAVAAQPLDVNKATSEQLADLPGIGPAKAAAIVAARAERPFSSVDDLERVKGIGPSTVAELRDRISAGPAALK